MEALFTVIARSMGIEALQVEAVMTLLREGSSVPFIARYRKERTKGLDEDCLLYTSRWRFERQTL